MLKVLQESLYSFISEPFKLYPITIVFIVGVFIQGIKIIIDLFRFKSFSLKNLYIAGGFPSFHSGISSCVTTLAFLYYGFDSVIFSIAFVFSLLFSYDAMNLRYQAGQHAHYINKLRSEIGIILEPTVTPYALRGKLSERIGHTIREVLGGIFFGTLLTFLLYYYFVVGYNL